jgi:hypothetical protein
LNVDELVYFPYKLKPHLVEAAMVLRSGAIELDGEIVKCGAGDYIVRDATGRRFVLSQNEFLRKYEKFSSCVSEPEKKRRKDNAAKWTTHY